MLRTSSKLLVALLFLPALGCSDDPTGPTDEERFATIIEGGWQALRDGDAATSYDCFLDAVAMEQLSGAAHLGIGWSALHLGDIDRATESLSRILGSTTQIRRSRDEMRAARAGLVVAHHAAGSGRLDDLVSTARVLLDDVPDFAFERLPGIDWRDIRLLLARSLLLLGDLEAAAAEIVLVGGTVPDPVDASSTGALLEELERLFTMHVSDLVTSGGQP